MMILAGPKHWHLRAYDDPQAQAPAAAARLAEGPRTRRGGGGGPAAGAYRRMRRAGWALPPRERLEWARGKRRGVIVTDPHLPDEEDGAAPAFAVLNANQRGCNYPDKHL